MNVWPSPIAHPHHLRDAVPVGTVCMYAGQVQNVSHDKNPAWNACQSESTDTPAVAGADADAASVTVLEALGWMVCDGRSLEVAKYPRLAAVISPLYGSKGSGEFNLPDYRGIFLRGVDDGAGADPDVSSRRKPDGSGTASGVGSIQCDAFQLHQHTYDGAKGGATVQDGSPAAMFNPNQTTVEPVSGRHSSETRPRNAAIYFIIRVF